MNQITGFAFAPNAWIALQIMLQSITKSIENIYSQPSKKYELWNKLLKSDKKETFYEKLQKLYLENPMQSYDCDSAIKDLFWEIFVQTIYECEIKKEITL